MMSACARKWRSTIKTTSDQRGQSCRARDQLDLVIRNYNTRHKVDGFLVHSLAPRGGFSLELKTAQSYFNLSRINTLTTRERRRVRSRGRVRGRGRRTTRYLLTIIINCLKIYFTQVDTRAQTHTLALITSDKYFFRRRACMCHVCPTLYSNYSKPPPKRCLGETRF